MNEKDTYTQCINEYAEQDERLQDPQVKQEVWNNDRGLSLEKLMKIGKGTREIHYVEVFGDRVPLRLISEREAADLQHETVVDMAKKYPAFKGALYNINYEKMFLRKQISLSTSVCLEVAHKMDKRYLTEDDVGELPAPTFAALVTEYQRLEKEYNPVLNQISDEDVNYLLARLLDPTKKSIIMSGLTLAQTSSSLSKLLDILIELEDNTSIIPSLIDTLTAE